MTDQTLEKKHGAALAAGDDIHYKPTQLALDPNMGFDRWMEVGLFIGSLHRASSWFIGDWLIHGEAAYGERYSQAVNDLGLDYKTCVNTAYVCRHVPPARRRSDLSFSHHAEVAQVKDATEQRRYLKLAVDNGWTRAQLREAVKHGGELPEGFTQPQWSKDSGIHAGGSEGPPLPDGPRDHEADAASHADAQQQSPGQQIPAVSSVRGEPLLPPPSADAFIPDSADEVYEAARRVADAAIIVVRSRGKKGIGDLRKALVEAGFLEPA